MANGDYNGHASGALELRDSATAANATITARRGETLFVDSISAEAPGGLLLRSPGGNVDFLNSATAGNATISAEGGAGNGGRPAIIRFSNQATAGAAVINLGPGALGPNFKFDTPNPIDGFGAAARFAGTTTAGTAQITNAGATFHSSYGHALTTFSENSSADHAVFVNQGATEEHQYAYGGGTQFLDNATAASGTFTNHGGGAGVGEFGGGITSFFDTSTAGTATFTNKGSTAQFAGAGMTRFMDTANAGQATFINEGGFSSGNFQRGATKFRGDSSAANGTFINKAGPAGGGAVEFYDAATAANATFTNENGVAPGTSGGELSFNDQSTADHGVFTATGSQGGYINFHDHATAAQASFVLGRNDRLTFSEDSTAASSDIVVGGSGLITFQQNATAANATIELQTGDAGGNPVTGGSIGNFFGTATAGSATINVRGAGAPNAIGGALYFQNAGATAGSATITLHGASVTTFGAYAGSVRFDYNSDAGSATLIATGGSSGGQGGGIVFARGAKGNQARIVLNGNSSLDVAGNLYSGGTSFGSVEGAGTVILGGSLLTIGTLNTSTTISGLITDGPLGSNTGGQLTKTGTGTLALGGVNTYSGLTTVDAGTLLITGSLAGPALVKSGATLKGTGNIAGAVTVEAGGIVSPGASPGSMTVGGLVLAGTSVLNFELGTTSDKIVVNGGFTLDGVLHIADAGGLALHGSFELFTWTGTLTDNGLTIGTVPAGFSPSDFSFEYSSGKMVLKNNNVAPPPTINTPPTAASALMGTNAQFTVSASGTGLTYRWQRQGAGSSTWTDLANGGAYSGVSTATLSVTASAALNGDQFRVVVTTGAGSSTISDAAALTVTFPSRLLNLSTRGLAQSGDNVLIPGFVISGSENKRLLIRAVGPTLGQPPFNLGGVLPDPRMRLLKRNAVTTQFEEIATNDNWGTNSNATDITTTAASLFAFSLQDNRESALLLDVAPGEYTVIAGGVNDGTGIAIVELYDADAAAVDARLINISNRGFCGVGDQVMIPGFVVSSEGPKTVLVRVVGPQLADFGVSGTMVDPKLEIYPGGGTTPILTNDNWGDNPDAAHTAAVATQLSAFSLAAGSKDAAFVVTLPPGSYTVVGSSALAGGSGVVLVEVYVVP